MHAVLTAVIASQLPLQSNEFSGMIMFFIALNTVTIAVEANSTAQISVTMGDTQGTRPQMCLAAHGWARPFPLPMICARGFVGACACVRICIHVRVCVRAPVHVCWRACSWRALSGGGLGCQGSVPSRCVACCIVCCTMC